MVYERFDSSKTEVLCNEFQFSGVNAPAEGNFNKLGAYLVSYYIPFSSIIGCTTDGGAAMIFIHWLNTITPHRIIIIHCALYGEDLLAKRFILSFVKPCKYWFKWLMIFTERRSATEFSGNSMLAREKIPSIFFIVQYSLLVVEKKMLDTFRQFVRYFADTPKKSGNFLIFEVRICSSHFLFANVL